jgi:ribosome-interacting GTPase 1
MKTKQAKYYNKNAMKTEYIEIKPGDTIRIKPMKKGVFGKKENVKIYVQKDHMRLNVTESIIVEIDVT